MLDRLPVQTGTLRAICAFLNTFAIECFIDELAHAAGLDPVELRLRHLSDERGIAAIRAACDRAGLTQGRPRDGVHGMGIEFARYSNEASYAAVVDQCSKNSDNGWLAVSVDYDFGRIYRKRGYRVNQRAHQNQ